MRASLLFAAALAMGCTAARSAAPPVATEAPAQAASAPAEALPFIHDDYAGALKQAQARGCRCSSMSGRRGDTAAAR